MKKYFAAILAFAFIALLAINPVLATSPHYDEDDEIDICHATGSDSNPYVENSPDIQNDGSLTGGHLDHTGPLFPSADWGDIIPSYTHGDFSYPGMNWTTEGQAIWENDCDIPETEECDPQEDEDCVTPTPTPTPTPEPTQTTNQGGPGDGLSDGRSDGRSSCPECTQAPTGQVLGATTDFAATGTALDMIMNAVGALGGLTTASGLALAAKKKFNK